jgi:hypothetical protein
MTQSTAIDTYQYAEASIRPENPQRIRWFAPDKCTAQRLHRHSCMARRFGNAAHRPDLSLVHCTALHCTALHCESIALHCTALHCTALHCTALHCTALHCESIALHCTAVHCESIALPCTALHCTVRVSHALSSAPAAVLSHTVHVRHSASTDTSTCMYHTRAQVGTTVSYDTLAC